jgi:hypothetical protein
MEVVPFFSRSRVALALGLLLSCATLSACDRRVPSEVATPAPSNPSDPGMPVPEPSPPSPPASPASQ